MPTYEYHCPKCQHEYERFQSINSDPHTECPKCATQVRRLVSGGTGVIFKGSGFHVTDYKSNNSGDADKKAEGTSENKKEGSGEGKNGKENGVKKDSSASSTSGAGDKSSDSGKSAKSETSQSSSKT